MTEVQLKNACEERDNFKRDLENVTSDGGLSKDQLIRKAWEVRDAAVKRKNAAEVELAKERIGVMQVREPTLMFICLLHCAHWSKDLGVNQGDGTHTPWSS